MKKVKQPDITPLEAHILKRLKQYEENLPFDLQKELEDLKAMREASRIKG